MIRPELPEDRPASIEVQIAAFDEPSEAAIVEAVRDLEGSFALVAELEGVVIGHVQLSRAWVGEQPVSALGPIGVEPKHQGVGVGSALVLAALKDAQRRGETAVILLGSPAFYTRFGFLPGARFGLRNPFAGVQENGFVVSEEDFMLAPLGSVETEFDVGDVRWHEAFGPPLGTP